MKTVFCPDCLADRKVRYIRKSETFIVRDEAMEIESNVAKCNTCGNEVFDMEADASNLRAAYDKYRVRHGLLTSKQIEAIRKKYGLSLPTKNLPGNFTLNRYGSYGQPVGCFHILRLALLI
ncbi:MAG TPA: hypothetical protein GX529_06955 [Firmicutes bacterium]|nr:hypothetical protein [Candidatus Fermentithermobacillaceae bacterium]